MGNEDIEVHPENIRATIMRMTIEKIPVFFIENICPGKMMIVVNISLPV
ncbi:MAG: hypothetical protein WC620_11480 [Methanoregula sp.]|jgi:hypothetical protein